jgi:hypothetical protein
MPEYRSIEAMNNPQTHNRRAREFGFRIRISHPKDCRNGGSSNCQSCGLMKEDKSIEAMNSSQMLICRAAKVDNPQMLRFQEEKSCDTIRRLHPKGSDNGRNMSVKLSQLMKEYKSIQVKHSSKTQIHQKA